MTREEHITAHVAVECAAQEPLLRDQADKGFKESMKAALEMATNNVIPPAEIAKFVTLSAEVHATYVEKKTAEMLKSASEFFAKQNAVSL